MSLQETICRAKANEILDQFMVGSPDEIDLETIAWHVGRLRIEYGHLDTAEGRLIAGEDGGIIRVREGIKIEGRRRFVIAHEIGHFCLHKLKSALDTVTELTSWRQGSKETEANIMAGELLMPERLFKPKIAKAIPSLAGLDTLANNFRTSKLATAVQFVTYSNEPCALVVSKNRTIQWSRKSPAFEFWLRGELHPYSGAAEIFESKYTETGRMVPVAAGAWLEDFNPDGKEDIREDSRLVHGYDMVVTLLWIKDCI